MRQPGKTNLVQGRIIVGFKNEVPRNKAEEIISGFGLTILNVRERFNQFLVKVPNTSEDEWVQKFKALQEVSFAEREHLLHTC